MTASHSNCALLPASAVPNLGLNLEDLHSQTHQQLQSSNCARHGKQRIAAFPHTHTKTHHYYFPEIHVAELKTCLSEPLPSNSAATQLLLLYLQHVQMPAAAQPAA
jgi:hypothetical protein